MITPQNFKNLLQYLGFTENNQIFNKNIHGYQLKADFVNKNLIYPKGLMTKLNAENFSRNENFVVFECVHNLLNAGYTPEQIELERGKSGGHHDTGGYCDIIVYKTENQNGTTQKIPYLLIECKTTDNNKNNEFDKAWGRMQEDGGQLFNYYDSFRQAQFLVLYASDWSEDKHISQKIKVIKMDDNPDFIELNPKLDSFQKVNERKGEKKEYFQVWRDTYQMQLLDADIFAKAFHVDERARRLNDLQEVSHEMIQGKYNQFAEILRTYNVSGRENAFDKLVNLFLAKVVDEQRNSEKNENEQDLKFYWKGIYDSYFDLQDRLQNLYKSGMEKFLSEEITYVQDTEISEIFDTHINGNPKTIKDEIFKKFRALKYYTNNDFAFIDVHNQELFRQNAVVLTEMMKMLQDIKLQSQTQQHQFLGDLFEGFLDSGVKQSEGQFFTPMPIVKFLISSLPLKMILDKKELPKTIDYACGAGHFLTEYAQQIKSLLEENNKNPQDYYPHIHGIEKEYRLSKVAKVAAFMYGQDGIQIIYGDALAEHKTIQNNSYSILIANPPYSVKGFLRTLDDKQRKQYILNNEVNERDTFNAIETFFVERAQQLLKTDGVAAIILPSSMLTNGSIYVKCREILLQNFNIVAIVEFGAGTFGKTNTNTVALFLRKKSDNLNTAGVYRDAVNDWFSGSLNRENPQKANYANIALLQQYCQYCGFDEMAYRELLHSIANIPEALAQHERFIEYRSAFNSSTTTKKYRNQIDKLNDKLAQETQTEKCAKLQAQIAEKTTECERAFVQLVKEIEADKLHYFMLTKDNQQNVLVIKTPSDTKEKKAFLGYEWSMAKGNEGIKYLTTQSGNNTDSEDEVLQNLQGINKIKTPLFNPQNLFDENKLNHLIRQNFSGSLNTIPEHLANVANLLPLTEMLDFGRVEFDKAIRTNVQKKIEIVSKFPLVKLGDVCDVRIGGTPARANGAYFTGDNLWVSISEMKGNIITDTKEKITENAIKNSNVKLIPKGTTLLSFKLSIGRTAIAGADLYTNEAIAGLIPNNQNKILDSYLFHLFNGKMIDLENVGNKAFGKSLNSKYLREDVKIPLPPLDIQQKIVEECEKIDEEFNQTRMKIEEYRSKIAHIFNELDVIQSAAGGGKTL